MSHLNSRMVTFGNHLILVFCGEAVTDWYEAKFGRCKGICQGNCVRFRDALIARMLLQVPTRWMPVRATTIQRWNLNNAYFVKHYPSWVRDTLWYDSKVDETMSSVSTLMLVPKIFSSRKINMLSSFQNTCNEESQGHSSTEEGDYEAWCNVL